MIGWLLDTALYTGLLIALVLVLRRPAAKLFGAQTAYALLTDLVTIRRRASAGREAQSHRIP